MIGKKFATLITLSHVLVLANLVHANDPRQVMIQELAASAPHPSLGDEARIWDRLVGVWDADFSFHQDDGNVRHESGEILFGWVLDGRAIQDLWISYPKDGTKERSIGTSLRFFDPKSKLWTVVFLNPAYPGILMVQGKAKGDRIVLLGKDKQGSSLRWSFNNITADSFVWQGETSRDGGKTWRLEEEHHMRRRPQPAATKSREAFQHLTSLVGKWKAEQAGMDVTLTYTLTADGSALMEELRPANEPVMITMFTVDGDRLIATHYCSLGNQPQMATEPIADADTKTLTFSLVRVTGLKTPDDWHNTGLKVLLEDPQHLTQEWSYLYQGKKGNNTFHFTRMEAE